MKPLIGLIAVAMLLVGVEEALARGGRLGGGRGARSSSRVSRSGNRSPSMSRPSRPSSRPSVSRPNVSRPSNPTVSRPTVTRPNNTGPTGTRSTVRRPGGGKLDGPPKVKPGSRPVTRPGGNGIGTGNRPSSNELQNFLNLPQDRVPGTRPAVRPGGKLPGNKLPGDKLGSNPNLSPKGKIGEGKLGKIAETKPGQEIGQGVKDRFPNRSKDRPNWSDRKQEIGNNLRRDYRDWSHHVYHGSHWNAHFNHWGAHYHHWHFGWHSHPHGYWWRWATWPTIGAWFIWNWNEPYFYDYGNTVYYENNNIYYQDKAVATGEEYAEQANSIASDLPEEVPAEIEWMPLGVFALSSNDSGESNMVLQMAVSKEGYITGTYYNSTTESTIPIEGKVDQKTQRAAWKLADGISPIVMETGVYNLTLNETVALVHFSDERTEEWLMVRLEEPKKESSSTQPQTSGTPSTE